MLLDFRVSAYSKIHKLWVSHLHFITQTLKELVEKLPYLDTRIYCCCYTHVSLITTKNTLQRRLLLPWHGSATVPDCTRLTQYSHFCFPLLRGCWGRLPYSLVLWFFYCGADSKQHCSCSCVNEVSCLGHSHPKTPSFQENSNHKCRNVSPSHVHYCYGGMS